MKNISSEALQHLVYPPAIDNRKGVSVDQLVKDISEEDSVISCAYALLKKSRWELFFRDVTISENSY